MAVVKDTRISRVGDGANEIAFKDNADRDRRAKGVVVIDADGNQTLVAAKPAYIQGDVNIEDVADTPESFEDTSFVTGDSPVTLDCNDALGRNATKGYITNDGLGNFTIAFATDSVPTFGDEITMKRDEVFRFDNLSVDSIRITWVADSAYRVVVV